MTPSPRAPTISGNGSGDGCKQMSCWQVLIVQYLVLRCFEIALFIFFQLVLALLVFQIFLTCASAINGVSFVRDSVSVGSQAVQKTDLLILFSRAENLFKTRFQRTVAKSRFWRLLTLRSVCLRVLSRNLERELKHPKTHPKPFV